MTMMPHKVVKDATVEDYRAGGRQAGEAHVRSMRGDAGFDKWLAARNQNAFKAALAKAINEMIEGGATPDKIDAWNDAFCEELDKYTKQMNCETLFVQAIRGEKKWN